MSATIAERVALLEEAVEHLLDGPYNCVYCGNEINCTGECENDDRDDDESETHCCAQGTVGGKNTVRDSVEHALESLSVIAQHGDDSLAILASEAILRYSVTSVGI